MTRSGACSPMLPSRTGRRPTPSPPVRRGCFDRGREAVRVSDADLLVFGEMGIGNTTPAAAVTAALFDVGAEQCTGRGTGVDDEGLERKQRVVETARRRVRGAAPIEALRQ